MKSCWYQGVPWISLSVSLSLSLSLCPYCWLLLASWLLLVFVQSCYMYDFAGHPVLLCSCVGVIIRTSLIDWSPLLQLRALCHARPTQIRWDVSGCTAEHFSPSLSFFISLSLSFFLSFFLSLSLYRYIFTIPFGRAECDTRSRFYAEFNRLEFRSFLLDQLAYQV